MLKQKKKKILITGGHLTPAIAVIERLDKNEWEIIFMGRKLAQKGASEQAKEMREIQKLGVEVITIPAGKLPRHFSLTSTLAILRVPAGFFTSFLYIKRLKPELILSFGGYVALPAAISGKLLGIPVITHEQTVIKGLANSIIELFADAIAISWKESEGSFRRKVTVTGNPLREAILHGPGRRVPIQVNNSPLLYITGGSQGAHAINVIVKKALPTLLKNYALVHQCGFTKDRSDYRALLEGKSSLPADLKDRYCVRDWFTAEEVAWLLRNADLVISRCGANTISEIAYTQAIALLIPLPIAGRSEQLANAKLLEKKGSAQILPQSRLSEITLKNNIHNMLANSQKYKKNTLKARKLVTTDATGKVIKLLNQVYEKTKK